MSDLLLTQDHPYHRPDVAGTYYSRLKPRFAEVKLGPEGIKLVDPSDVRPDRFSKLAQEAPTVENPTGLTHTDFTGVKRPLGAAAGGVTLPVPDTQVLVKDPIDPTKVVAISAALVPTLTTRTLGMPPADSVILGDTTAQIVTNKTLVDASTRFRSSVNPNRHLSLSATSILADAQLIAPALTGPADTLVTEAHLQVLKNKILDDASNSVTANALRIPSGRITISSANPGIGDVLTVSNLTPNPVAVWSALPPAIPGPQGPIGPAGPQGPGSAPLWGCISLLTALGTPTVTTCTLNVSNQLSSVPTTAQQMNGFDMPGNNQLRCVNSLNRLHHVYFSLSTSVDLAALGFQASLTRNGTEIARAYFSGGVQSVSGYAQTFMANGDVFRVEITALNQTSDVGVIGLTLLANAVN